jgi:hypothetical protein
MHFDITIFGTILCRHFLCQTHISNFAADESSLVSCSQVPLRDLTLTCCPWTWPETWTYRFYAVTSVWIFQCLPAHCALHTADRFRAFVLFSLAISSYTEPSPVSTDKYFCCCFLWTHRLHSEIMLSVEEWNRCLLATEFVSILEQSFVPDSLSECSSNGCNCAAKEQRSLFQKKMGI